MPTDTLVFTNVFSASRSIARQSIPDLREGDQLNAIDNGAWAVGKWWCTFQSQNGPVFARGYWSMIYVGDADGWKIRMSTFNQTSPPVVPAETN
jgi:hypothetical protein